MENARELVIIKTMYDFQETFENIDKTKVRRILEKNLCDYVLVSQSTELIVSDLKEKIIFFLRIKKLEGLADDTLQSYYVTLNEFSKHIIKSAAQINTNDIRTYLYAIQSENNIKKTTINTKIIILKSFFKCLLEEELIKKNPMLKIKTMKVDKRSLRTALTIEELEKLRNACKDIREKAIVEFYYSTGCRLSEPLPIEISDINWNECSLIVVGKGSKEREVYFSKKCKLYLEEYFKTRKGDSQHLFCGIKKPYAALSDSGIQKIVKKIAKRTDIKKNIHPHILRHTFATLALQSGMSEGAIQELLGHTNIDTTKIYAKINKSTLQYEYNKTMIG